MADQNRFLRDVRDHKMTIEHDEGVFRSLRFGRPQSSIYYFRLNTWPGHLSISGDAGSYTFARLHDMFEFFRCDRKPGSINESYWSEKLVAVDKHSGATQLDEDAYVKAIRSEFAQHISGMSLSDAKKAVREARWDNLFDAPSDEREAVEKAMGWRCPVTDEHPFNDFWEHRLTEASYRLVWCMRAIAWGIKRYDLHKQGRTQAEHDKLILAGAA